MLVADSRMFFAAAPQKLPMTLPGAVPNKPGPQLVTRIGVIFFGAFFVMRLDFDKGTSEDG